MPGPLEYHLPPERDAEPKMAKRSLVCLVILVMAQCLHGFLLNDEDGPIPVPELPWWKTTIIYQIYPRSFKDSDGDGIGDIPGIISELPYFKEIGVETIWISPIYKSPQADFGYDVSDQKDIDPLFGNIYDFRKLVETAIKLGIRIILDFVVNHTSNQHIWFQRSVRREGKYTDFFIWSDGRMLGNGIRAPPNNWISIFGGSAWEWNSDRQQYYLHQFVREQPDLNYRNPDVREEILLAMRYWLDQGIDGMRMDAIADLYESADLSLDNPRSGKPVPPDDWNYLIPKYTDFLPEVKDEILRWQGLFDSFKLIDGRERFMILEIYTNSSTRAKMAEYGAHPFNFDLVDSLKIPLSASDIMGYIAEEFKNKPDSYWPTFVVGNHDRKRIATKYGRRYVDAFNMLLMTLKGTPTTYYGEELGMEDIEVAYEQSQDPWAINAGPDRYMLYSRDVNRSPMQWTPNDMAGFTTGNSSWLPIQPNYTVLNVETERKDPTSHLSLYKEYSKLRQLPAFKYGDIDIDFVTNDNVLSFIRSFGKDRYLVAINFGQQASTDDYTSSPVNGTTGVIRTTTGEAANHLSKGQAVNLYRLTLQPGDGVVIEV